MTSNKNDPDVYTRSGSNPNNITSISDVYSALFYGVRSDPKRGKHDSRYSDLFILIKRV